MVVSQRQPQLFFKPSQVLGKPVRASGQAAILLPLGEVIPLDETRVDGVTDRRLGQSRRDGRPIPKDHVGVNCRDPSPRSLLDHLGIQQVGTRSASGFGMGTACPAPHGTIPFPLNVQQRLGVSRPLIAGEKGYGVIGHPRHLLQQAVRTGLIVVADHEAQYQAPDRRKGQPHPGVSIRLDVVLGAGQVFLFGMDKAPQFIQLALRRRQLPPQGQHHRPALARRSIQPGTDLVFIRLDNPRRRSQRIPLRQRAQGNLEFHRIRPQAVVGGTVVQGHATSTGLAAGLRFAPATAIANQPRDFERFSIILAAKVRAIQRLPVQASILNENMICIEDANLSSKTGIPITEV